MANTQSEYPTQGEYMIWIGVVASIGAFIAFIDYMLHLPPSEFQEFEDTEYPKEEDE